MFSYKEYIDTIVKDDLISFSNKFKNQAKIDFVYLDGNIEYPLFTSIENRAFKIIKFILKKGIDLNILIESGYSLNSYINYEILRSSEVYSQGFGDNPSIDIIENFIQFGSNINISNGDGYTSLDLCVENFHYTAIDILLKKNAKHSKVFFDKVLKNILSGSFNNKYLIKMPYLEFLSRESCIETKKISRLHYQIEKNLHESLTLNIKPKFDILKYMLDFNLNINEKNEDGKTPVDYAIELCHTEAVKFLREHGGKTSEELEKE